MGRDEYYARVQGLTEEALERLSLLTPTLTDFVLHYWAGIRAASRDDLAEGERTSLENLSFFYFLATCIDFLFFLHLRHRGLSVWDHELEHILSVMITHARAQREALAEGHGHEPPGDTAGARDPLSTIVDFEDAVRRLRERGGA